MNTSRRATTTRHFPIYEELISAYRGTGRAADVYYKYAYCEYNLGDLIMANYRFRQFHQDFPKLR